LRHCPQKVKFSSISSSSLSNTSSSLHVTAATTHVLGGCKRLVVVMLIREELMLDKLDTTDNVEHTVGATGFEKGGKTAPLQRGKGRICCFSKSLPLSWESLS
jgi:hypothetical protein